MTPCTPLSGIAAVGRATAWLPQVVVVLLWTFVTLPLTMVGAVLGRNIAGNTENPCRVNPIPRPIPEKKWYGTGMVPNCCSCI